MYLKWSIILSIFEGHRVVLVVPYSNTNVCCSSPLIVGLTMTGETGIRTNIQSFPLATLPRQNFSSRNICCLLHSIVAVMTRESLGLSIRVHSSLSLECHRVAKNLWSISSAVLRCSEGRSYTIREDSSLFFSVVTRWLRRRGQLLDDQWWQSIAEEAVRETFSQMEPNRAWSQNCSCLTSLDGCSFTVFFSYFNNFTNNRHICQNALWWVWAGVWVFGKPCKGNQKLSG